MTIGINAQAAVKQPRTGVEEYTYQLIKHLTMLPEAREHRFFLYIPFFLKEGEGGFRSTKINPSQPPFKKGGEKGGDFKKKENIIFDFPLPPNFEIKILRWPLPFLWTQIRLAWELWRHKPDALFIPAHVFPPVAPANSIVAIHGLEYEYFSQYYSVWRRWYLRWSTKQAVKRAKRIIAISENTKNDLVKLYGVAGEKIGVVWHGVNFSNPTQPPLNLRGGEILPNSPFLKEGIPPLKLRGGEEELSGPYILYLGRLETKKNIQGVLAAYRILKEKYNIPHQLVLAGSPGYGYKNLKFKIENSLKIENCKLKIKELGYVAEDEKWRLLSQASIFLFPSFYEGFGLPILEAQSVGVPVITSYGSCLPEVAGEGALFVNPRNPGQIAEAVKLIIDDNDLRDRLKQSGFENIRRFSWAKCAKRTLEVIVDE